MSSRAKKPKKAPEPLLVKCPVHKVTYLKLVRKGDKLQGICDCKIFGNRYAGKVVYEKTITKE